MSKRKSHTKNHAKKEMPRGWGADAAAKAAAERRKRGRQAAAKRATKATPTAPRGVQIEVVPGYVERLQEETYRRLAADDSKHRPAKPDALTTGAARATGMTARAVRRSKAMTKYEYDQATGGGR